MAITVKKYDDFVHATPDSRLSEQQQAEKLAHIHGAANVFIDGKPFVEPAPEPAAPEHGQSGEAIDQQEEK